MPVLPYPGVYIEEISSGVRSISGVATSIAAFVGYFKLGPLHQPQRACSFAEFEQEFGGLDPDAGAAYSVAQFFLNGGTEAWIVRVPGGGGGTELVGDRDARTGLQALLSVDLFNLLCLPDTMLLPEAEAAAVASAAEALCAERRAFYLLDPPLAAGTLEQWLAAHSALRHPNAALYFPRPLIADPLGGTRSIAASGSVAGVYARTDAQRGVWHAPAGTAATLLGVTGLEGALGDAESDALAALGINPLRHLPQVGTVCWGARTLVGNEVSDWRFVPVRRLALFLEESLQRGTRWVLFEQNGEDLWARVRQSVDGFLLQIYAAGGLQGAKPEEAWFVKCDRTTMTQDDLDQGRLVMLIGFAPVRPAEFVVIRIQQHTAPPPHRKFHFRLRWEGRHVAGVTEVSGMAITAKVDDTTARKVPDRRKFPEILLRRGIVHDPEFAGWVRSTSEAAPDRRSLAIEIVDETGRLIRIIRIRQGWVTKYDGPELNGDASEVAIEEIWLAHEGLEIIPCDP